MATRAITSQIVIRPRVLAFMSAFTASTPVGLLHSERHVCTTRFLGITPAHPPVRRVGGDVSPLTTRHHYSGIEPFVSERPRRHLIQSLPHLLDQGLDGSGPGRDYDAGGRRCAGRTAPPGRPPPAGCRSNLLGPATPRPAGDPAARRIPGRPDRAGRPRRAPDPGPRVHDSRLRGAAAPERRQRCAGKWRAGLETQQINHRRRQVAEAHGLGNDGPRRLRARPTAVRSPAARGAAAGRGSSRARRNRAARRSSRRGPT